MNDVAVSTSLERVLVGVVESFESTCREFHEDCQKKIERFTSNLEALARLQGVVPFSFSSGDDLLYPVIRCEASDLPKIRKALRCPLKIDRKEPVYGDMEKINVWLRPTNYKRLSIVYTGKIKPGSKCRVVEHTYTTRSVVCSV